MCQMSKISREGVTTEKGEHKTIREVKRWMEDLRVLEKLTRYEDPPLQPVRPIRVDLARYGLGDASKVCFGVIFPCPGEEGAGTQRE